MTFTTNRLPVILSVVAVLALATAIFMRPPALPTGVATFAPAPVADSHRRATLGLTYAIDAAAIAGNRIELGSLTTPLVVQRGQLIDVMGWALDPRSLLPALGVAAGIDNAAPQSAAAYGLPRPDVARALGNPDTAASGFDAAITFAGVGPGAHVIRFAVVGKDGKTFVLPSSVAVTLK